MRPKMDKLGREDGWCSRWGENDEATGQTVAVTATKQSSCMWEVLQQLQQLQLQLQPHIMTTTITTTTAI